ncbi:MAG: sulfotransferase family protein [Pseudomonadota bacterium]
MSLKVIGAGFGRTGTASLKIALEQLLGAPCYHMSEAIGNAGHIDLWIDAAAGKPDWDAIFGNYAATVDFPASNYWRELAAAYPDAKIVLSIRDAERWFQSTQETIFSKKLQAYQDGTKWGRMIKATIDDHLGGDVNDREAVIAAFNQNTADVKAAFGPDRLLVFEAKDGWAPLCELLSVPVPDEPYPHVNSKEEFDAVFELLESPMAAKVLNGEGAGGEDMHEEMFEKPLRDE